MSKDWRWSGFDHRRLTRSIPKSASDATQPCDKLHIRIERIGINIAQMIGLVTEFIMRMGTLISSILIALLATRSWAELHTDSFVRMRLLEGQVQSAGVNCWGTALYVLGGISEVRWVSSRELIDLFGSEACRKLGLEETPHPGDIATLFSYFSGPFHSYVVIDSSTIFEKKSPQAFDRPKVRQIETHLPSGCHSRNQRGICMDGTVYYRCNFSRYYAAVDPSMARDEQALISDLRSEFKKLNVGEKSLNESSSIKDILIRKFLNFTFQKGRGTISYEFEYQAFEMINALLNHPELQQAPTSQESMNQLLVVQSWFRNATSTGISEYEQFPQGKLTK